METSNLLALFPYGHLFPLVTRTIVPMLMVQQGQPRFLLFVK
uniref:Uncharacterized protein n=1 Tax=Nelumbo nucifera TaxID=4432 RepID=A0A822Z5W3_NELNU|nr:TPA_asm: hypothetical protein HUJ06_013384 [Nelumbo nucifera]